jgi:hypothetical protein
MDEYISVQFDRSPLGEVGVVRKVLRDTPHFEPPPMTEDVREIACRGWEDRTRSEYVGVMIVRRFHGLLADLNAPMDLQEMTLAIQLQEQQHANLCMAAAMSLGSDGAIAFSMDELRQARTEAPVQDQFMEMLVGTFLVGERVALELLKHAVKTLPDSTYRDVLRGVLKDEVLHATFAPRLLRHIREEREPRFCPYPGDDWVKQFLVGHLELMAQRDVVEDDEAVCFSDPAMAHSLMAVGIPPSTAFKATYMRALDEDITAALVEAGLP